MILIVGLGNPGDKYKNTWHNLGFLAVDEFKEKNNFPDFKLSKKFNALVSEENLNGEKIVLAKPQTFMNNSGRSVGSLIGNWKLEIGNLIIVHDDIDLPLGKIKISKNSGSAGHKGVESIIKELGRKDFTRIRIGIQPEKKPENAEDFVLRKIPKEKNLKEILEKAVEAAETIINEGIKKEMNLYN